MAAVPVTISGVLCDKYGRTIQVVTLVGDATFTGLGVGGGPPPGGVPPSDAHPEHPIYWPPGTQPHPEHPIVLPPEGPPTEPPPDGGDKPPPPEGGWGFVAEWSQWGYFPNPNQARPKA